MGVFKVGLSPWLIQFIAIFSLNTIKDIKVLTDFNMNSYFLANISTFYLSLIFCFPKRLKSF